MSENGNKSSSANFFKKAFSLEYISLPLAFFSLILNLLVIFMLLANYSQEIHYATISLFFISFILALSGVVIEFIKIIRGQKAVVNVQLVAVMFAIFISCIVAPITLNFNAFG